MEVRVENSLRRSLRFVIWAWVGGALWLYITTGALLTRYAQWVGLPPIGFGIMAAVPFVAALFQLPASWWLERHGHRKRFFIGLGLLHRALWLVIAVLPWVLPASWQWPGFLVVLGISWVAGQMIVPAWVAWMGDLVPARIRGRFFSRRTQLGQLVGLVTTWAIGAVLDWAATQGEPVMARTISIGLAVAGVAGMLDFLLFLPVESAERPMPARPVSLWELVRAPLADVHFRRFLGFHMTLTFGTAYLGPFFWLYAFEELQLTNVQANVWLVILPMVMWALATPLWGRVLDRFGRKPVLWLAGIAVVLGSAAWVPMTEGTLWPWYGLVMLANLAWPGIELANFNVLLRTRDATGQTRVPTSGYVVVCSVAGALAGSLAGLVAGGLAEAWQPRQPVWLGVEWTYHRVLFVCSSALRLVALGWLVGFRDVQAGSTRMALRYLGTNIYSNLQQTVFLPIRLLSRVGRMTYKVRKSSS
ncbi:MAG: MFS transporter [Verrucomicrobiae bacterium]|nr:MFS transporter [Verrucomicrobiae bacterium]